jgi:hypothetical protein
MAYDKQATFFTGTETTITTGSINSLAVWIGETKTNTDIMIDARVTTAFAIAGSTPTLTLALQTSDTISGTVLSGTITTLASTATLLTAALVAGYKFSLGTVPQGAKKYIAIQAQVGAGGTFTNAGRIFAAISENITSDTFKPNSPPTGTRY